MITFSKPYQYEPDYEGVDYTVTRRDIKREKETVGYIWLSPEDSETKKYSLQGLNIRSNTRKMRECYDCRYKILSEAKQAAIRIFGETND